jgi:hypothetical protein
MVPRGELALGKNVLVAYMRLQFGGKVLISERLVYEDI